MKLVSIKKVGIFSFFKLGVLVFGVGGALVGLLFALINTPFYTKATINGAVVGKSVVPATQFLKAISNVIGIFTMYGVALAIILTLLILLFNLTSRFHGGVKVYIEKED